MSIGMLRYDRDPKTDLAAKIRRAMDYYIQKYGGHPNLVQLHPSMMDREAKVDHVVIRPSRYIQPGHLWIGVEDKS